MAIEIPNFIPCAAVVTASAHVLSPAAPVTFGWTQGIDKASSTHTVVGQYDIFLTEPLADTDMGALVTEFGTTLNGCISVLSINDFHKRVETLNSTGSGVDTVSFYIEFRRVPAGIVDIAP